MPSAIRSRGPACRRTPIARAALSHGASTGRRPASKNPGRPRTSVFVTSVLTAVRVWFGNCRTAPVLRTRPAPSPWRPLTIPFAEIDLSRERPHGGFDEAALDRQSASATLANPRRFSRWPSRRCRYGTGGSSSGTNTTVCRRCGARRVAAQEFMCLICFGIVRARVPSLSEGIDVEDAVCDPPHRRAS